ncbi:MAG TPA: hypothetical protein VFW78_01060 [Bacteroidia bacterium]|nr:hypothetical protein [Bacteroidia bacterium]
MLKRPVFFVVCCFVMLYALPAAGQLNPNEYVEEKPPLLKNEWVLGLNIHSAGWGFDFRRGKNLTVNKKRMFELEVVNIKHPKEVKSVNPYYDNAKSFFYGKLNTLTAVRFAIGQQQVLFNKAEKNGVEVRLNYTGGLSLGLAKPIYLNIVKTNSVGDSYLVVEKYDPEKHFVDDIYGRASFTNGLGEMKPYPGFFGKLGLSFEYGSNFQSVKMLEAGITVDAYGKKVPIMAFAENSQVYFNFYINILYGKKW